MAEETISCSICVDLIKDPVTIPCGHSYCMSCIKTHWDIEKERRLYSCPVCRQTFKRRPGLRRNTMLAGLVVELKKTGLQATPVDQCYAGPEDVACDVCTGRKLKAVKSCLVCLASYCVEHLQPHNQSPTFKKHKLVAPTKKLQEKICPRHDEVMKMFCRTDQQCICYLCSMDQHKDHSIVTAEAERTERQRELELSQEKVQQKVRDTEEDVGVLQQVLEAANCSADKAEEDNEKIFTELMGLIQKRRSDVKQEIRLHREKVGVAKELQKLLEQEITMLKRRDTELKQLSQTEDHNQFLNKFSSLSPHPFSIDILPLVCFMDPTGQLQDILSKTWRNISLMVYHVDGSRPQTEPWLRAELLQYSKEFMLDPNTANTHLLLCDGNRTIMFIKNQHSYFHHPDKFTDWPQALSTQVLTGRCYWEVECTGKTVGVAVAYKNIEREGSTSECGFGFNDKSWCLYCNQNFDYYFFHNSKKTPVSGPLSFKLGVYLDHTAGILCFYSICDTMTLLHRVQTTFTQPLYAGLSVLYVGDTAEIC